MNKPSIREQIAKIVFDLAVRAKEESPDFIWLDPYTDQILSLIVKEAEGMKIPNHRRKICPFCANHKWRCECVPEDVYNRFADDFIEKVRVK